MLISKLLNTEQTQSRKDYLARVKEGLSVCRTTTSLTDNDTATTTTSYFIANFTYFVADFLLTCVTFRPPSTGLDHAQWLPAS